MSVDNTLLKKLYSLPNEILSLNKTRVKETMIEINDKDVPTDKKRLLEYLKKTKFGDKVVSVHRYISKHNFNSDEFYMQIYFNIKYVSEDTHEIFKMNEKYFKHIHIHFSYGELDTFKIGIKRDSEIYNFAKLKVIDKNVNKNSIINKLIHKDCAKNQILALSKYIEHNIIEII